MQIYDKLLWSLKLFVTLAIEQTFAFLDLSIDILCNICDESSLFTKILLSYICKTMWYMLRNRCSFQIKAIVRENRFNTLIELRNLLSNDYHCIKCNILHSMKSNDISNLRNWYRRRHSCRTSNQMFNHLHSQHFYAISFHHVQLALKYSRMKKKHQNCRTNIL